MSNTPAWADKARLEAAGVSGAPVIALPFSYEAPISLNGVSVLADVQVGKHTYMNGGMIRQRVNIGRYCSIGRNVLIAAGDHPLDGLTTHPISWQSRAAPSSSLPPWPLTAHPISSRLRTHPGRPSHTQRQPRHPRTEIGHDVWISDNVVVIAGVHIGTGAVIGANSVVTRDVPPYMIVGGVPARKIRPRFSEDIIAGLLVSEWWTLPSEALKVLDMSDVAACLRDIPGLRSIFGADPIAFETMEG